MGTNDEVLMAGFIYVVPGRFDTNGPVELYGGLYAKEVTTNDDVVVHFDRAIGKAGQSCEEEPPDDTNDDTPDAGQTPDAGENQEPGPDPVCASGGDTCTDTADCCTPLTCHEGSCSLLTCQPAFAECSDDEDCCSSTCATAGGSGEGVCMVN